MEEVRMNGWGCRSRKRNIKRREKRSIPLPELPWARALARVPLFMALPEKGRRFLREAANRVREVARNSREGL